MLRDWVIYTMIILVLMGTISLVLAVGWGIDNPPEEYLTLGTREVMAERKIYCDFLGFSVEVETTKECMWKLTRATDYLLNDPGARDFLEELSIKSKE